MQPPGFDVEEGQGVTVSGTVAYTGETTGTIRVDFLRPPGKSEVPGAVHTMKLEALGDWSVEVPKDFGELVIVSFIDANDDGPSRDEPKVVLEEALQVAGESITGIELVVQDDWDDNHKQPGAKGMPPEMRPGNAPPPPGTAPPEPEPEQAQTGGTEGDQPE